ncbi:unnamed protein product [Pieris brassicae]|uniref:Uncharacterized protein n=1 Tax=Pieris brassicae TaxID=7116 RepID=A0A9P0TT79_PIEBR|nr:unnamed protein product [Pieris brassicae]
MELLESGATCASAVVPLLRRGRVPRAPPTVRGDGRGRSATRALGGALPRRLLVFRKFTTGSPVQPGLYPSAITTAVHRTFRIYFKYYLTFKSLNSSILLNILFPTEIPVIKFVF